MQISLNNQNNTCISIKNLGMQMEQLAKELTNNQKGVFRVNNMTIQNSIVMQFVGTKGVSQVYHLSFDDNKVLKIINWTMLKVYSVYRTINKDLFTRGFD